ncbi:MAG: hypothetical protein ACOXZ4_05885 [Sphaerochaetaceae bacterium]|jgi:uncharacterized cysteine cluster protein YcgN (CxxCxxCC family)
MKRSTVTWEDRCLKCGLCCCDKVIIGKDIVYMLDSYCQHFDPKTKTCTVYFERLEKEARCRRVTRFRAMFASYLPDSCAYVQWARSKGLRFAAKRTIHYARGNCDTGQDEDPHSLFELAK